MKKIKFQFIGLLFLLSIVYSCAEIKPLEYHASDPLFNFSGRIDKVTKGETILIGSASSATMTFAGDSCTILLKNNTPNGLYNFYSLELDGEYIGRFKIEGDTLVAKKIEIPGGKASHRLSVYKSTEASNGNIVFAGLRCIKLLPTTGIPAKKIEFIGNSITCGMGADTKEIPCGTAQWYDQHNAYLAYGPRVARQLNLQYMLSSVSGIGIYRNWNSDGPAMPQVYENRYLDTDSTRRWDFTGFVPDIVSIALGTNDFSDGDGTRERKPFDPETYVNTYIAFVEKIYSHYPNTQIALLTSPMVSGEKEMIFFDCLNKVKTHFDEIGGHKSIAIYRFQGIEPHGCSYHPDIDDHAKMAEAVIPFFQQLLNQ